MECRQEGVTILHFTCSLSVDCSDLSSASPLVGGRGHRSPTNMPPPLTTPTRLQTLRNQTLKLHLPGSGRNYISLPTSTLVHIMYTCI